MSDVNMEEWKSINNFPNNQISNTGNVKGVRGTILKTWLRNGYNSVSLFYNKKQKTFNIHRLVSEHFLDKIDGKTQVNHKDL